MSKDRAAPFSRKHRRYWITITGGMLMIGAINIGIGFCTYHEPSELHQRIELVLPPPGSGIEVYPREALGACPPALATKVIAAVPDGTIIACTASSTGYAITVSRASGKHTQLEIGGDGAIAAVIEPLGLAEIPAPVMRAFAVTYLKTIPAKAAKRSQRGAEPVFELTFPPGRDGSIVSD